jgi:hypothetical protein
LQLLADFKFSCGTFLKGDPKVFDPVVNLKNFSQFLLKNRVSSTSVSLILDDFMLGVFLLCVSIIDRGAALGSVATAEKRQFQNKIYFSGQLNYFLTFCPFFYYFE